MKIKKAVKALSALAQESRLGVFRLLVKRGPEGFTPGELSDKLKIPAPTLSFHLKGLQHAGLVETRRAGRFLYYSANFKAMNDVIGYLTENCCSMSESECDTNCTPVAAAAPKRRRQR